MASWYDRDQEEEEDLINKGARISVLDRGTAEYRHALLVVPSGSPSSPSFTIANTHAGGLAWYGRFLYVSDTDGIRVFDMSRIWQVKTGIEGAVGRTADGYGAYGYKYVVPQVHQYERNVANTFRYSSVAVDRTTSPDTLVATEYRKPFDGSQEPARTVTYSIDQSSGSAQRAHERVAPARAAWRIGVDSLQGGVFVNGKLYLSQSDGRNPFSTSDRGDVYRYTPSTGQLRTWADHLPIGTEDLSFWAGKGELWTTAEYPELRGLYGLDFGYYSPCTHSPPVPRRWHGRTLIVARGECSPFRTRAQLRPGAIASDRGHGDPIRTGRANHHEQTGCFRVQGAHPRGGGLGRRSRCRRLDRGGGGRGRVADLDLGLQHHAKQAARARS